MVDGPSDVLRDRIRSIPDFPKKGIVFRDITPLLQDPGAYSAAIEMFSERYHNFKLDKIVSIESRGFILGSALAYRLHVGFVPVRKPHKLPSTTISESYTLEYGTDTLEMHTDAINRHERVLVLDDLLATGGTARAVIGLVERLGGTVAELGFLIELSFLGGREHLRPYPVFSIINYSAE